MHTIDDYRKELTKLDNLIGGEELSKIDNIPASKQLVKIKKMIQDDNHEAFINSKTLETITDDELTILVRNVASDIDNGNVYTIRKCIQPFINIGITANMHVGKKPEEFEGNRKMTLEWYAGSIIDIVYKQSWFAVNSWINCVDKFAPLSEGEDDGN